MRISAPRSISSGSAWLLAFSLGIRAAGAQERPPAPWPPPEGQIRVIIDADFANEIDDQYALALALGSQDRLRIEGIIAAHFGDRGGSTGIDQSFEELQRVLQLAGMSDRFRTFRGLGPLQYLDAVPENEAVDFIIETARTATPEDPIWLVLLGPATDAAAALLKEPGIADRMVVFWHGRTQWPVRAWNFNAYNDLLAVRTLFDQAIARFVLFDTGTYLRIPIEETERRFAPLGPLGAYLHEIRGRNPGFASPRKGFFDLGDVAALVDPSVVRWERVEAPSVDRDMRYDFSRENGEIVRIYHVESDPTFDLLEQALRRLNAGG